MSWAAGANATRYGSQGIQLSTSSNVRPGSTGCSMTTKVLSPETTTTTRRTSSKGRAAGRGGGAEEAHPQRESVARRSTAVEARSMGLGFVFSGTLATRSRPSAPFEIEQPGSARELQERLRD